MGARARNFFVITEKPGKGKVSTKRPNGASFKPGAAGGGSIKTPQIWAFFALLAPKPGLRGCNLTKLKRGFVQFQRN